jgi:hypothetical protein
MIDPPVQTVPAIPTLSSVLCKLQPTAHLPKAHPDYVSNNYLYVEGYGEDSTTV